VRPAASALIPFRETRCDKRVIERLTRECLRDGGRP